MWSQIGRAPSLSGNGSEAPWRNVTSKVNGLRLGTIK